MLSQKEEEHSNKFHLLEFKVSRRHFDKLNPLRLKEETFSKTFP